MVRAILVALLCSLAGCASDPQIPRLSDSDAVQIAKDYLATRGVHLGSGYVSRVEASSADEEAVGRRPIYVVHFGARRHGKLQNRYDVHIDARTRKAEDFTDERNFVPIGKPSNQAMQRTAGRSAFTSQMTSTFNPQQHAPSPAVADLGSR